MRSRISFLAYCCFFSLLAHAQETLVFHRITTEQGLAHDNINCFAQDKRGFIWIGTSNGLCRYDGSRIITFKNNSKDSNSISDNGIMSLLIDSRNNIWAGTYWAGLNKYDEATQRFTHFVNIGDKPGLLVSNSVLGITELDSTHLLLGQGKLLILDIKNRQSETISTPVNSWSNTNSTKAASTFSAYNAVLNPDKSWWLTGEAGLVKYDPVKKQFELLALRPDIPGNFKEQSTYAVVVDKHGNAWFGSAAGLLEYNSKTNKFIEHFPAKFAAVDAKMLQIRAMLCDEDGSLWFGGSNGLFHYFPETGKYFVYRHDPGNSSSLSDNNINCIYKDRQGILWIGTANGLNAIYPGQKKFEVYHNLPGNKNSLQSNKTKGSFKDKEGNTWIGTQVALECVNAGTGQVSQYYYHDPGTKNYTEYAVMPILPNDSTSLWIGTWGNGLQLFDHKKRRFLASYIYMPTATNSISSNHITGLCKDDKGNLWIATWNGGVEKFNIIDKKFTHYSKKFSKTGMPSDYITSIFFDGQTTWAGFGGGMLKYEAANDRFKKYNIADDSAASWEKSVTTIAGSEGDLWLGTFKGLVKFNGSSGQYSMVPELANEGISGIYVDDTKKLWLASSWGLKYYDPVNRKLLNYTLKDGLPITYFPITSYFSRSNEGEILLNSDNGLIHFDPAAISQNIAAPALHITSIKIENKEMPGLGNMDLLNNLDLAHDQNYLAIGFAAMNFINPSLNQYAYKLDGFDKDWVQAGNHNEALYTNLEPGNYTFHVKASNDAGVWNETGIGFNIHIRTPWWKTWWFYTLIVCTVLTIAYVIYHVRIKTILAEQQLRNKIARDLHDDIGSTLSGLKLFSNIALQQLKQEGSGATSIVERIGERSEKAIGAMSDIVWSIDPRHDSIGQMLVRMREYAAEMLESKNIGYRFLVDDKMLRSKLPITVRKDVYLVFKEAINNAMKHAECRNVLIELSQPGEHFSMTIRDDGKGFDYESIKKGNGLPNLKARAENAGGEMLIVSKENQGTTITLSINVT